MNSCLRRRYANIADRWGTSAFANIRRDDLLPRLMEAADLCPGQRVLEVMCGTGGCLWAAYDRCDPELTALDFSRQMLDHVPEHARKVCRSVLSMPFAAGSFDRVFLRNGLYDLPVTQQPRALRAIRRVIEPRGIFILQTYYTDPDTRHILNTLTNAKDLAAGHGQLTADRWPRYFATRTELRTMFEVAGWRGREICRFSSRIVYRQAGEMDARGFDWWTGLAESYPPETLRRIRWQANSRLGPQFSFPGVVYRLYPYRA